jgi:hypothetical protein
MAGYLLFVLFAPGYGDFRRVGEPQLTPGPLVERGPAEAHDVGRAGPRDELDLVTRLHLCGRDAVRFHGQPAAAGQDFQAQLVGAGDHQPAVVRRVRGDWRHDQAFDSRADDRAAGREAVRGRARRGRHHQRVGGVTDERVARGQHPQSGDLLPREPDERHVVERRDDLVCDHRVDGQPGFGAEVVPVDRGQRVRQVGHINLGQEPQLAQVHPEYREPLPVGQPHGAQHGAVPAHADQQVGALTQLLGGHRGRAAGQVGQLAVDPEDLDPALIGPVEYRGHRPAAVPFRMQQQPDDAHALTLQGPAGPFARRTSELNCPKPGRQGYDGQS